MVNLQDYLTTKAIKYDVPSEIAHAIALVKSNLQMDKVTALPGHLWLWDTKNKRPFRSLTGMSNRFLGGVLSDFETNGLYDPDTEWACQRMAWGPFQMPGATLRQAGYTGFFPTICCDPELAALWGCRHLSYLRDRYYSRHSWSGVIAAFDLGRPRRDEAGYVNQAFLRAVAKAGAARFT